MTSVLSTRLETSSEETCRGMKNRVSGGEVWRGLAVRVGSAEAISRNIREEVAKVCTGLILISS